MIQKFRKKPVVIEAIQFNGHNHQEVKDFGGDSIIHEQASGSSEDGSGGRQMYEQLHCKTLEGQLTVSTYDFIIKGVKGEFYPCKPDIFHATYEPAE